MAISKSEVPRACADIDKASLTAIEADIDRKLAKKYKGSIVEINIGYQDSNDVIKAIMKLFLIVLLIVNYKKLALQKKRL